jgi:molybdopterin synthase sulfur carrier subunit
MAVTIRIPVSLQKLTGDQPKVEVDGASVQEVVDSLESRYPGIRASLLDDSGNLRRFVNIFVNEDDIRQLQGQQTRLKDGDEVYIVPAIAGGKR